MTAWMLSLENTKRFQKLSLTALIVSLLLSVICVKSEESRSAVNTTSTIVSVLLVLMMLGIVALALVMNFLR